MQKNKQVYALLIIVSCILLLGTFGYFIYKNQERKEAYDQIQLTFKNIDKTYEVGTTLNAVEFIKSTNAKEVDYPIVKNNSVGEKPLVYVAYDSNGYSREFVVTIIFVDSIKPILTLHTNEVEVEEGQLIDLKGYIKEGYDPVDGELKVSINKPKNWKQIGVHSIVYSIVDQHGNKAEAVLSLVVKEKKIEQPKPAEKPNTPQTQPNAPANGNGNASGSVPGKTFPSQRWMFVDGYMMFGSNAAMDQCMVVFNQATRGICRPIYAENGIEMIGVEYLP